VRLPPLYWPFLLATAVAYMTVTQLLKTVLLRRKLI